MVLLQLGSSAAAALRHVLLAQQPARFPLELSKRPHLLELVELERESAPSDTSVPGWHA
jgi:hypothetical protein